MPYNLNIPGWMPESELKIIEQVAARLNDVGGQRPRGGVRSARG